jgi:prepilin-type N-terminal cleavage/methylation domain-containing protein
MKKYLSRGFTLVELLIVIALLGVIATIVIAAINPIEQANRAADAGMKADASQLVSAIDRYYASHNSFPWNNCSGVGCTPYIAGVDTELPFTSADTVGIGLCGAAGAACKTSATQGELITALELQTAFLSKSWIGATTVPARIYIGKATGASSAVYACWVPKANSNRQNLINSAATSNKMVDETAAFTAAGIPAPSTACTAVSGAGGAGWLNGTCAECVPE